MIKFLWEASAKVEGEADDLVKVVNAAMTHLAAIIASEDSGVTFAPAASAASEAPAASDETPPTVAPDAPWTQTEPSEVPSSGAPALDRATEEQLAQGADLWIGVLTAWRQGFMDDEAEQPDRLKILMDAVTQGGTYMFATLRHYAGLTRLVRGLLANTPKKRARRIAENIAQVSSAAGIPVISDYLEYTQEYLGEEYRNG